MLASPSPTILTADWKYSERLAKVLKVRPIQSYVWAGQGPERSRPLPAWGLIYPLLAKVICLTATWYFLWNDPCSNRKAVRSAPEWFKTIEFHPLKTVRSAPEWFKTIEFHPLKQSGALPNDLRQLNFIPLKQSGALPNDLRQLNFIP